MFARAFSVFNVAQTDGYEPPPVPVLPESERLQHAEAFIGNLGIRTIFEADEACYRPSTDTAVMPPFACPRFTASGCTSSATPRPRRTAATATCPAASGRRDTPSRR